MSASVKIGDLVINSENIFHLLAEKQMIAPLAREIIIDRAIASIPCSEEEIKVAEQQFFLANADESSRYRKTKYMVREKLSY